MITTALGVSLGIGLGCVLCLAIFAWLEIAASRKQERLLEIQLGWRQPNADRTKKSRARPQAREHSVPEREAGPPKSD